MDVTGQELNRQAKSAALAREGSFYEFFQAITHPKQLREKLENPSVIAAWP